MNNNQKDNLSDLATELLLPGTTENPSDSNTNPNQVTTPDGGIVNLGDRPSGIVTK